MEGDIPAGVRKAVFKAEGSLEGIRFTVAGTEQERPMVESVLKMVEDAIRQSPP